MTSQQSLRNDLPLSSLAFLFSDFFVHPLGENKLGALCPASGTVVPTDELAVTLGMIAVVGLRDEGVLHLEPYNNKKLSLRAQAVRAHLLYTPPPPPATRPSSTSFSRNGS